MKSLQQYIGTQKIITAYIDNLNNLPIDKQQHFISRLSLIDNTYVHKVSEYMNVYCDQVNDIYNLLCDKKYKNVVNKYVLQPYKTTNDKKLNDVKDWIESITDDNIIYLLAIGVYVDKLCTLKRNGFDSTKLDLNKMLSLIDPLSIYSMLENTHELREKEGTLYINCAGYIYNLFRGNSDIENAWLSLISEFVHDPNDIRSIYGTTHIILQASNFYTTIADYKYEKELSYINELLNKFRLNSYENTTLDMLCELALCLKYSTYKDKFTEWLHVVNHIKVTDNILHSSKKVSNIVDDLTNNEHTNALYILLVN